MKLKKLLVAKKKDPLLSKNQIIIRFLEEKDHTELVNTLNPWNYKIKGTAFLKWLGESDPAYQFSVIALLDNEIIGFYGAMTVPLKINDRLLRGYRAGVFVHENHRKKKYSLAGKSTQPSTVFNLIASALVGEVNKRKGIIYGFPIPVIVNHYLAKYQARIIRKIPKYTFFLKPGALLRAFLKRPNPLLFFRSFWSALFSAGDQSPNDLSIKRIHSFDARFDALWEKISENHGVISMRNAAFLNWRYLKEPKEHYTVFAAEKNGQLQGYIILKSAFSRNLRVGIIADFFCEREPLIGKALISRAAAHFRSEGAQKIDLFLSDSFCEKWVRSAGYANIHGGDIMIARSYDPSVSDSFFYDSKNWFITTADTLFA